MGEKNHQDQKTEFLSRIQILFHFDSFLNAFLRWNPTKNEGKYLRENMISIVDGKPALVAKHFYNLNRKSIKFFGDLKQINQSKDAFNSILQKFHEFSSEKNIKSCRCPTCEFFLIRMIDCSPENNSKLNYTLHSDSIENWGSTDTPSIDLDNFPINLVVRTENYGGNFYEIECSANNKTKKYKMIGLLGKNINSQIFTLYLDDKTGWQVVSKENINDEELQLKDDDLKYLFYEIDVDQQVLNFLDNFLKNLFLNFFSLDNFLDRIQQHIQKKNQVGWIKKFYEQFKSIHINKQDAKGTTTINDFSVLAKEYLKISRFIKNYNLSTLELNNLHNSELESFLINLATEFFEEINLCEASSSLFSKEGNNSSYFFKVNSSGNFIGLNQNTMPFEIIPNYLLINCEGKLLKSLTLKDKNSNGIYHYRLLQSIAISNEKTEIVTIFYNDYKSIYVIGKEFAEHDYERFFSSTIFQPYFSIYIYDPINQYFDGKKNLSVAVGTVPLPCINNYQNLCYINCVFQALFNIYSIKKDFSEWNCDNQWAREIKAILEGKPKDKNSREIPRDFEKFREAYVGNREEGSAHDFLSQFIKKVHDVSNCSENLGLCPSCKNFRISGVSQAVSRDGSKKKKVLTTWQLVQHLTSDNIKLRDNILVVDEKTEFHFDINPPWVLFIQLESIIDESHNLKKEHIRNYLRNNELITYKNNGKEFLYRLKSIILLGSKHYKSLLFSRTHQKWFLTNDNKIEPIYYTLEDYDIESQEYIPTGLLYYQVIPDYEIENYIITMFRIFSGFDEFEKKIFRSKTYGSIQKLLRDNFLKFSKCKNSKLLDKSFLNKFKKQQEIRTIVDVLRIIVKIIHKNKYKKSLELKKKPNQNICKCFACIKMCFEIIHIEGSKIQKLRSLDNFPCPENVFKSYNIEQKAFATLEDLISDKKFNLENLQIVRTPDILPIILNDDKQKFVNLLHIKPSFIIEESFYKLTSMLILGEKEHELFSALQFEEDAWTIINTENKTIEEKVEFYQIFQKNYIPQLLFYSKEKLNYIKNSINLLYMIEPFKNAIIKSENSNSDIWLSKLLEFLKDIRVINDLSRLYEFKLAFNKDYDTKIQNEAIEEYDIEHCINVILTRIHKENIKGPRNHICPVCDYFLIKGTMVDKKSRHIDLFGLNINHYLNTKSNSNISGNVLCNVLGSTELETIEFIIPKPPKFLYYTLTYDRYENDKMKEVVSMYRNFFTNHKLIQYRGDKNIYDYFLRIIIFQLRDFEDRYYIARYISDDLWDINGQEKQIKPEFIIQAFLQEKNYLFLPTILFYEKLVRY